MPSCLVYWRLLGHPLPAFWTLVASNPPSSSIPPSSMVVLIADMAISECLMLWCFEWRDSLGVSWLGGLWVLVLFKKCDVWTMYLLKYTEILFSNSPGCPWGYPNLEKYPVPTVKAFNLNKTPNKQQKIRLENPPWGKAGWFCRRPDSQGGIFKGQVGRDRPCI